MAAFHPLDMDSDSLASSPRSDHYASHDPRVRLMCSFGGKILPRPHDNQLRYVGGDTRIIAAHRSIAFSALLAKVSKLSGISDVIIKYQLPNEDFDALISVTTDEDVENLMEEYERIAHSYQNPRSARLRLFLFPKGEESRPSSISSLLGSANRENWFFDALNSSSCLERGRSTASSVVSEAPDYLFGVDNSDDTHIRGPKMKNQPGLHDNISASNPGSPIPVLTSPCCSTTSSMVVPSAHDLAKPNMQEPIEGAIASQPISQPMMQPVGFPGTHMVHHVSNPHPMQHTPVYYIPHTIPAQSSPIQAQYPVHQYRVPAGQIPTRYHAQNPGTGQVYTKDTSNAEKFVPEMINHQFYYGIRNASTGPDQVQMYPGSGNLQRTGSDARYGRTIQQ